MKLIILFPLLRIQGMIMLTLTATIHSLRPPRCAIGSLTCETPSNFQYAVLYMNLINAGFTRAWRVGGTRFTIALMGAEQFDKITKLRSGRFLQLVLRHLVHC
jgi:peptide/histidine transporter 3/4